MYYRWYFLEEQVMENLQLLMQCCVKKFFLVELATRQVVSYKLKVYKYVHFMYLLNGYTSALEL